MVGSLAVQDIGVSIGRREIVRGVSARFEGGQFVGVLGPNGAGKSTLVRAMLGLLPHSGRVLLDDAPLADLSRAGIARRIAYLPQGQALHWPLAVERLVALGRLPHLGPFSRIGPDDRAAIDRAMAAAEILALAQRTATDLSGGERARVLLARALAVEAPVLVADEPLASLDPDHQLMVLDLLRGRARAGGLVLAVLHDLGLAARYCDRVLVLADGRVAADGVPDRVLTPALLARVYGVRVAGDGSMMPLERLALTDAASRA